MNFNNPEFVHALREVMRGLQDEEGDRGRRYHARRGEPKEECKANELPEFVGGTDPDRYLEWERKIERVFEFKDIEDDMACKLAILKLSGGASLWYEGLKSRRNREGKEKINSWLSLKRKLRKRFVPPNHRLSTYKKIVDLKQQKLSVGEYIDEFEKLSLIGDVEEVEEQKMTRFLKGLNYNISNVVELLPFTTFEELCGVCVKIEAQVKSKSASTSGEPRPRTWAKPEAAKEVQMNSDQFGSSSVGPTVGKQVGGSKETSLAKVRCFKCQGFGHYQSACPNKRVVTLREAVDCRDELLEEEKRVGIFTIEEEEESEEEEEHRYVAPQYDTNLVIRSLQTQKARKVEDQRDQLFKTICLIKEKRCSVIIDGGSCTNVAAQELVTKLDLPTTPHPRPYALHWLDDGNKVKVNKQVKVCLTMGAYQDEVVCDVLPMDACHVLLGRPWQYDRDVVHHGKSNEYVLKDKGKRIVLVPMPLTAMGSSSSKENKKPNLTMMAAKKGEATERTPMNVGCPRSSKISWKGLFKKEGNMAVDPTLVTPKVVFPTFSKPFTFGWSVESDCLAARVANRGFGMKERGSKVGLAETGKTWNCLGKGELAMENNLVQGIQCDAILTLLFINYLNRLMQRGGVQNLPKIVNHDVGAQSDVKAVVGRGDSTRLKETCNGVVWSMGDQGLSKNDLNQDIDNIKQGLMKTNLTNYPLQVLHVQIERRGCLGDFWLKNIKTRLEHATMGMGLEKRAGIQKGARFKEGEMVVKERGGCVGSGFQGFSRIEDNSLSRRGG